MNTNNNYYKRKKKRLSYKSKTSFSVSIFRLRTGGVFWAGGSSLETLQPNKRALCPNVLV